MVLSVSARDFRSPAENYLCDPAFGDYESCENQNAMMKRQVYFLVTLNLCYEKLKLYQQQKYH